MQVVNLPTYDPLYELCRRIGEAYHSLDLYIFMAWCFGNSWRNKG